MTIQVTKLDLLLPIAALALYLLACTTSPLKKIFTAPARLACFIGAFVLGVGGFFFTYGMALKVNMWFTPVLPDEANCYLGLILEIMLFAVVFMVGWSAVDGGQGVARSFAEWLRPRGLVYARVPAPKY